MTYISPLLAATTTATGTTTPATGTGTGSSAGVAGATPSNTLSTNQLGQLGNPQLFLQLLVAELQNQDPTNPMNPSTILSQTANLSQMEAVTAMTKAINQEQSASQASEATGLIGKTVTASVNNTPLTGTVSQIQLSPTGAPSVLVNGTSIPLADITSVGGTAAAATTGGTTTGGTTTTATGGTSTTTA